MGRRKKKLKTGEKRPAPQEQAPQKTRPALQKQPEPEPRNQPETGQAAGAPAAKRKGVPVSTCIAGMFLTLVLGLYLGSLMPGMLQKPDRPVTAAMPAAPAQEMIDAAPNQELERMIAELEKKAAANPQSAPDWINLANIYFDAMRPALAVKAYEHALALAPDNADVLTDLGIMYRETGQFEKAVDSFRKAIEINPGHENAMFNQGVVLATDLKRNAEAAAIWKKLLDINPQARAPDGKYLKDMVGNLE